MSDDGITRGRVSKLVRVPIASKSETQGEMLRGYGIVRAETGRDVFFEGDAVVEAAFADLEVGDHVTFKMEQGPFARASEVRLVTPTESNSLTTEKVRQ